MVGNGDVGIWWITLMWNARRTVMWNVVGNDGVKYGGLLWCGIWWRTLMWNAPENGYVRYGGER